METQDLNPTPPRDKIQSCEQEGSCVSCEECLAQIDAGVALRADGDDYVRHFCGDACYETWRRRHGKS